MYQLPSWSLRELVGVGLVRGLLPGHIADQVGLGILLDLHGRVLCECGWFHFMHSVRQGLLLGRFQPQLRDLCCEHVLVRWVCKLFAVRRWFLLQHYLKHVLSTNRLPGWHLRHSQLRCLLSGYILCGGGGGMQGLCRRYLFTRVGG